jgi:hypothetical protein
MSEKKSESGEEKPPPRTQTEKQAEEPPAKKAPYVFKILPADPKNSFDFEDVADK